MSDHQWTIGRHKTAESRIDEAMALIRCAMLDFNINLNLDKATAALETALECVERSRKGVEATAQTIDSDPVAAARAMREAGQ